MNSSFRAVDSAGRVGSGPGEFRQPVAIGITSDERVVVLDRALRRIEVFAHSKGNTRFEPAKTVALGSGAESMCALPEMQFLVYAYGEGKRLRIVDSTGQARRWFADADSKFSPMAGSLMAAGPMSCVPSRDEVLVSSKFLPIVEAFRLSTGERAWVDTLRPFRPLEVADNGKSVSIRSGRAGYSTIVNAFGTKDLRVFQTIFDARRDTAADTTVTYVYHLRTSKWSTQTDLPIITVLNDSEVVAVSGDEIPEARLYGLLVSANAQ